jgi:hypothetical protein
MRSFHLLATIHKETIGIMNSRWFTIRRIGLVGAFFVGFTPVIVGALVQFLLIIFLPSIIQGVRYGGYGYYPGIFSVTLIGIGLALAIGAGLVTMLVAFLYNVVATRFPLRIRIDIDD